MNTPSAFAILHYAAAQESCEVALLRALRVKPLYAPLRSCIPQTVRTQRDA